MIVIELKYIYCFESLNNHSVTVLICSREEIMILISITFTFLIISPEIINAIPAAGKKVETPANYADIYNTISPFYLNPYDSAAAQAKVLSKSLVIFNLPESITHDLSRNVDPNVLQKPGYAKITKETDVLWKSRGKDLKKLADPLTVHNYKIFTVGIIFNSIKKELIETAKSVKPLFVGPGEKACKPFETEINLWKNSKTSPNKAKLQAMDTYLTEMIHKYNKKTNELRLKLETIKELRDLVNKLDELKEYLAVINGVKKNDNNDAWASIDQKLEIYSAKINEVNEINIDVELIKSTLKQVNTIAGELCEIRNQVLKEFPKIK